MAACCIRNLKLLLPAFVFLGGTGSEAWATEKLAIELPGTATIPGDAIDLSGDTALLQNGEPRNRLGGLSALEYSEKGMLFASISDRGPDDGAVTIIVAFNGLNCSFRSSRIFNQCCHSSYNGFYRFGRASFQWLFGND